MVLLENIYKIYKTRDKDHIVLIGVNLKIELGEKVGILGKNGAGKSTLIRIISGQEIPDSGIIKRDMKVSWPLAFSGGFQGSLSGFDNLKFISRIYDKNYNEIKEFVEDFSELGKYLYEPVKNYSSGMQARLAFALSLAIEFDCYLIDEIIAVGDSRFHEKCVYELFEKRKDRSFIIVSHNDNLIKKYCNRTALLDNGDLIFFENVNESFEFYNKNIMIS